jgi:hypothetical protein
MIVKGPLDVLAPFPLESPLAGGIVAGSVFPMRAYGDVTASSGGRMALLLDALLILAIAGVVVLFGSYIWKYFDEVSKAAAAEKLLTELRRNEALWVCIAKDPLEELYRYQDHFILTKEKDNYDIDCRVLGALAARKRFADFADQTYGQALAFGDWEDLLLEEKNRLRPEPDPIPRSAVHKGSRRDSVR